MNLWKVIVATLAIFVTGVVTGGLLVSYADRVSQRTHRQLTRETTRQNNPNPNSLPNPNRPLNAPNAPNRGPQRALSLEFLQKLDTEVRLTSGQRERIEQILADGQTRNKQVWEKVAPDISRENMETRRRVREVLTEDQIARFDELMKQPRVNKPALRDDLNRKQQRPVEAAPATNP